LKGYLTNITPAVMDGLSVVAAYQDLYQVERFFRMAKSDLAHGRCSTGSATASKPT
jgi:hypothetical protein